MPHAFRPELWSLLGGWAGFGRRRTWAHSLSQTIAGHGCGAASPPEDSLPSAYALTNIMGLAAVDDGLAGLHPPGDQELRSGCAHSLLRSTTPCAHRGGRFFTLPHCPPLPLPLSGLDRVGGRGRGLLPSPRARTTSFSLVLSHVVVGGWSGSEPSYPPAPRTEEPPHSVACVCGHGSARWGKPLGPKRACVFLNSLSLWDG